LLEKGFTMLRPAAPRPAANTPRLAGALLLAPLLAALAGAALILLWSLALSVLEGSVNWRNAGFWPDYTLTVFTTVIIAIAACYVIGLPLILAAWGAAHAFTRRSPAVMMAAVSGAGAVFSAIAFSHLTLPHAPEIFILFLTSGALAGLFPSWLIGVEGYCRAPAGQGLDLARPDGV